MDSDYRARAQADMRPEDWSREIRARLSEGRTFRAYDAVQRAIEQHPSDLGLVLLEAQSLIRTGSLDEAAQRIERADKALLRTGDRHRRIWESVRAIAAAKNPEAMPRDAVDRLVEGLAGDVGVRLSTALSEVEVEELFAEVRREFWRRTLAPADLRLAIEAQHRMYVRTAERRYGIAAAMFHRLAGNQADSMALAKDLAHDRPGTASVSLADLVAEGQLCMLLGDQAGAAQIFTDARRSAGVKNHRAVAEARFELKLLEAAGQAVADEVFHAVRPPNIAVFVGEALWAEAGAPPSPDEEQALRAAIVQHIDELDIEIAYSLASAGPELLFLEAMLDREAEVNLIVPFALEDVRSERVAPAGAAYMRRFDNVLRLASEVFALTDEPHLGDEELIRYAHRVMDGSARMRASALDTSPFLFAAIDLTSEPSSASQLVNAWGDPARLRIIDIDRSSESAAVPTVAVRTVKALLFSDIVGFSKIQDRLLPRFWDFITDVMRRIGNRMDDVYLVESWGDALYIAMNTATSLAELALALHDAFDGMDAKDYGLPGPLSMRTGLHAGPVHLGRHPMTDREIVFGSHVNRAARIEPITRPGQIYASQNFVALLVAEESEREAEASIRRQGYQRRFNWEYLGVQAMAKNYGKENIYHLTRAAAQDTAPLAQAAAQSPVAAR